MIWLDNEASIAQLAMGSIRNDIDKVALPSRQNLQPEVYSNKGPFSGRIYMANGMEYRVFPLKYDVQRARACLERARYYSINLGLVEF